MRPILQTGLLCFLLAAPACVFHPSWAARASSGPALVGQINDARTAPLQVAGRPSRLSLTNTQEVEIGRRFNAQIREFLRLASDPDVLNYVEETGQALLKTIEPQPFHYRFHVIEDDDINAFAVPGGYIYLNTGLLSIIETTDELAAVMAHEIAHVNNHHASQSMSKGNWLDLGTMAALLGSMFLASDNPKAAMGIIAGAAGANIQAKYAFSRQQEREADKEGVRYMRGAGYRPRGIQTLFDKMKQATRLNPTNLPPYLLTHPLEEDRIRAVAVPPEDGEEKPAAPDLQFEKFRAMVRVRFGPGREAMVSAYEQEVGSRPGPDTVYRLGMAYFAAGRLDDAAKQLDSLDAPTRARPHVERDIGRIYLEKGEMERAESQFRTAVASYPKDYLSEYLLAKSLESRLKTEEAIEHYLRAVEIRPLSADAHYQLGVLYGKNEKLGPAHYHLAMSFLANDDPQKTMQHFKKSISFFGEDTADAKRVKREMRKIFKE